MISTCSSGNSAIDPRLFAGLAFFLAGGACERWIRHFIDGARRRSGVEKASNGRGPVMKPAQIAMIRVK